MILSVTHAQDAIFNFTAHSASINKDSSVQPAQMATFSLTISDVFYVLSIAFHVPLRQYA